MKDKRVKFAGYRRPHPLFDLLEIKIQSNGEVQPYTLVEDACTNLVHHVDAIDSSFDQAFKQYDEQNNLYDSMKMGGMPGAQANYQYRTQGM